MNTSKKSLVVLFLISTVFFTANGQLFTPYIQLEGGVAIDQKNVGMLSIELGASYKWLDFGLMVDYQSDSFFKEYNGELYIYKDDGYDPNRNNNDEFSFFSYTSLQLVAKVDVIRIFTDNSRHAVKIGGGGGIICYEEVLSSSNFRESSSVEYELLTQKRYGMLGSFKVSYEYKINPKISLGTYFGGTYYPSVGLLIKYNL